MRYVCNVCFLKTICGTETLLQKYIVEDGLFSSLPISKLVLLLHLNSTKTILYSSESDLNKKPISLARRRINDNQYFYKTRLQIAIFFMRNLCKITFYQKQNYVGGGRYTI